MKQRVTKQQILELTEEQKHNLDMILHELDPTLKDKFLWYTSVQCTIGKMIEILDKTANSWTLYNLFQETPPLKLCDALWEAVKEVL